MNNQLMKEISAMKIISIEEKRPRENEMKLSEEEIAWNTAKRSEAWPLPCRRKPWLKRNEERRNSYSAFYQPFLKRSFYAILCPEEAEKATASVKILPEEIVCVKREREREKAERNDMQERPLTLPTRRRREALWRPLKIPFYQKRSILKLTAEREEEERRPFRK